MSMSTVAALKCATTANKSPASYRYHSGTEDKMAGHTFRAPKDLNSSAMGGGRGGVT